MRVTEKMIDSIINQINIKENRPLEPWTRTDKGLSANIGNLSLYCGLGVYALHETTSTGGGVHCLYNASNKKELYAYLNGRLRA